jgi:GLPGLI family protein
MKRLFINVIVLAIAQQVYAQTNLIVEYNEMYGVVSFEKQRKTEDFNRKEYLYTNGDSIAFFSYGLQKPLNKKNTIGSKKDHHSLFIFPKLKRQLHQNHWVKPYNLQEYPLPEYSWSYHSDTMLIAGYVCNVAVADGIVAWYSTAIKVPFGPREFYGLPGLILMLEDHRYKRLYKATSVRQHNNQIVLPDLSFRECKDCESKMGDIKKHFNP